MTSGSNVLCVCVCVCFRAAVLSPDDGQLTGPDDFELFSDLDGNRSQTIQTHKPAAGTNEIKRNLQRFILFMLEKDRGK